jgi:hypothetical protein
MKRTALLTLAIIANLCSLASGAPFDAAPFAVPLPEGNGLLWEDPRELHRVVVHFEGAAPPADNVHLRYWGSRWPEQHLPKDREPGGGDVGWMELGNWYRGGWRTADVEVQTNSSSLAFTFRPLNAKEFPTLAAYPARFRYTLKIRLTSDSPLPKVERWEAFTDSTCRDARLRLAWEKTPRTKPSVTVFNGQLLNLEGSGDILVKATANPDPNTFDKTLITVDGSTGAFTVAIDDVTKGALFLPQFKVGVLAATDRRNYAALAAEQKRAGKTTLYDRVSGLPEQTWRSAWSNMPPKKSHIYFPLGLDGGRQRFLLQANGTLRLRSNDHYLQSRPGQDTPRLTLEAAPVQFEFGNNGEPAQRSLQEDSLPICETTWDKDGLRVTQTAFLTELNGTKADADVPPADAFAVVVAKFVFENRSQTAKTARLPLTYASGDKPQGLRSDAQGRLWLGDHLRGAVIANREPKAEKDCLVWVWELAPGESQTVVVKLPYVVLTADSEQDALGRLDFETERRAVADYWRRRLDMGAELITPEPVLNQFYRANSGHLLINCEREPGSTRRFARVGSFAYGAYGNESCMMVADLERRGYHREAQECLDAWLHYQGTVALPGDFASQTGVLYGAGGYEAGGYNQHHGWILWCLAEHYRFTRDQSWLRSAAPGILAGADWIIRETGRTADRHELERGLLPAGSLEDIGDWWTWLSTSCYTWRGLDSAAWALEQIQHPEAQRVRKAAEAYHERLLANFRAAAVRSPVIRLRDGTAVPHFPSYVHRRGRSFGWICETLEGALHLLITGALDPRSPEAGWIVRDYEDNLFLSNQYGYLVDDFDSYWFGRGGMSMQACLLLDVEPYLMRDDVKQALRAMFNAIAVSHFPDVHMNTEHALPEMGDWRGDHYKSSDEANACGWLRQIFVREQGEDLLLGQAVPREWLAGGQRCGLVRGGTYFGPTSLVYTGGNREITARLEGPQRNPPRQIQLRFRTPDSRPILKATVNGKSWKRTQQDWVLLPGNIGSATVVVRY